MPVNLFGFRFGREEKPKITKTFVQPVNHDAALLVNSPYVTDFYSRYVYDIRGTISDEGALIKQYREMSISSDVEQGVDEIINDMITIDEKQPPVQLGFDNEELFSDALKEKIREGFDEVLTLLNFKEAAYDIARRWYVDARLYYQILIDEENPELGVQELRWIDPLCIKKIREVKTEKDKHGNERIIDELEYYVYNRDGFTFAENANNVNVSRGIPMSPDSIAFAHSGLLNETSTMILSFLHKSIKPFNNLRAMEDALVIYRITRAPERRIFNIDGGDMPPNKLKQYVENLMTEYRNKLVYDPNTGVMRDDRTHTTMFEDFWFPKRSDRGCDVTTLPGGQNLSEIADVEYFQKKLYKSLGIPVSRLDPSTGFNLGRSAEISREEVKFSKFITRLRHRFSAIFDQVLEKHLILKKVTTPEDWSKIREHIYYDFLSDSHFVELKDAEIMKERLDLLDQAEPHVGKYFSEKYLKEKILRQTDREMEEIQRDIESAAEEEETKPPEEEGPPEE